MKGIRVTLVDDKITIVDDQGRAIPNVESFHLVASASELPRLTLTLTPGSFLIEHEVSQYLMDEDTLRAAAKLKGFDLVPEESSLDIHSETQE